MLALMLCALQDLAPREDATEQEEVRLTWVAEPARPFVGQRVTLSLDCWIDPSFRAGHLVQPFARPIAVPVDVRPGDWPSALGEAVLLAGEVEVVLDGRPAHGAEIPGGVRLSWEATCERAGELVIASAEGWYSRTSEFREDLLLGPVPVDRSDLRVRSEALALHVREIPEAERPPEWSGAIGKVELWARVTERRLERGSPVELTLEFEGPGDPGDLSAWPYEVTGWRVSGRSSSEDGRMSLTLTAEADVDEVPAITLWWLDPESGRFEAASTEPIPLAWTAGPASKEPDTESGEGPALGGYGEEPPDRRVKWPWLLALSVPLLAWVLYRRR